MQDQVKFNPLTLVLAGDHWRYGLFIGMAICLVMFIVTQYKVIGLAASLLWAYVLGSALIIFEFPAVQYGVYNTAFMASAGQTFAEALLIPLVIIGFTDKTKKYVWMVIRVLVTIDIALVWFKIKGVMISPSFDTALIALFIPFMHPIMAIVSIITILTHHGSTAMMILISYCIVYGLRVKKTRLGVLVLIAVTIAASFHHSVGPLFDSHERLAVWEGFIRHWWDGTTFSQVTGGVKYSLLQYGGSITSKLFGTGPGSFLWLSILTEPTRMFLQAHSEPIQILFELGFVGLGLVIAVIVHALFNVRNNIALTAAVIGCVVCSLTYHPLRFMPTMILIGLIFREALVNNRGETR